MTTIQATIATGQVASSSDGDDARRVAAALSQTTGMSATPASENGGHSATRRASDLHDARMADHAIDSNLKKLVGRVAMWGLVGQLAVVNMGFGAHVYWTQWVLRESLPETVMIAWFSSTVVEVIGVVYVVAKYLFPESGNDWNRERD